MWGSLVVRCMGSSLELAAIPAVGRTWGSPLQDGFPTLQGCSSHSPRQTGTAGIVCLWKRLGAVSFLERHLSRVAATPTGAESCGTCPSQGHQGQGGF